MHKRILLCVMLLTTGFLMNTPSMAMQSESPVPCAVGTTILVYGDYTTGCDITPSIDTDAFNFDGIAGDVIRISLRTAGQLDGQIELRSPTNVLIIDPVPVCNALGGGCSLVVDATLTESGVHGIGITDSGSEHTGAYTLQLERIPSIAPQPLAYGEIVSDSISPSTDMDFFVFNAVAGNEVEITARTTGQLDGQLELWDPNGDVIGIPFICNALGGGCTVSTGRQLLTVTGTYVLAVSDSGIEHTGNYDLSLTCPVGPCPGIIPPRPECDIQLSQPTYVDGETVTADINIANLTGAAIALDWRVWVGIPGQSPTEIINSLNPLVGVRVFPHPTDAVVPGYQPFGPGPIINTFPRGTYELSCRFLDPVTGRLLMEDRNFFDILP